MKCYRSEGTPGWMAPELLRPGPRKQIPHPKTDMYAYGFIIFHVITRCQPWSNYVDIHSGSIIQTKRSVQEAATIEGKRPLFPDGCPDCFVKLAKNCWDGDETLWKTIRPSCTLIVEELGS